MKHLKIFVFIFIALFTVSVNAAEVKIGNDSTEAGAANRKVPVELVGSDLGDYTGVEFSIAINGTSYASYEFNYNASMTYKPVGNIFSITNSSGLFATSLGNVVYSTTKDLNSNFSLTPTKVVFIKSDGSRVDGTGSGGNITYIQTKSSDASLTSLTVSKGKLVPNFSKDIQGYTVTLGADETNINISADTVPGATKTGTGLQTLDSNNKTFNIIVTAEDGRTSKTYSITVLRGDQNQSGISTYLKSLKINTIGCKLSPKFEKTKTKYSVDVSDDISKLAFDYETEDPSANVKITGNKNFGSGKNIVKITVTSPDETQKTVYKITVNKKVEKIVKKNKKNEEKKSSSKKLLIIILTVLILLIVLFIVLFKKNKLKFLNKLLKAKGKSPKKEKDKKEKKKDKPSKKKKHKKKDKKDKKKEKYDDEDDDFDDEDEDEIDETTNYNSEDFLDKYEEEMVTTKEFDIRDFK